LSEDEDDLHVESQLNTTKNWNEEFQVGFFLHSLASLFVSDGSLCPNEELAGIASLRI